MAVDKYTGKYIYCNDYEVQDFYIRLPHYEKKITLYASDPICSQWRGSISKNVYATL